MNAGGHSGYAASGVTYLPMDLAMAGWTSANGLANSIGYDANGNTVSVNGGTAYSYGPFGALTNASGAAFQISAEGQRLSKSFAGNTTYFAPGAGGSLLAEDNAGQWHDYVWLNGRLIGVIANNAIYPVHSDQTGRPVAMTNASSTAIVWQVTGLPFDRTVTASTWGDFNIGFPGQYFDTEDSLWHNGYRDYDAAMGRFIEPDPIGLRGGVNMYTYVGDNPLSYVDPLGLCCSKSQKAAANLGEYLGEESEQYGVDALDEGAAAVATEGSTEGLGAALSATFTASSEVTENGSMLLGVSSVALNTYASSGDPRYALKFMVQYDTRLVTKSVLGKIPGLSEVETKFLSGLTAHLVAKGLIPSGTPCETP